MEEADVVTVSEFLQASLQALASRANNGHCLAEVKSKRSRSPPAERLLHVAARQAGQVEPRGLSSLPGKVEPIKNSTICRYTSFGIRSCCGVGV